MKPLDRGLMCFRQSRKLPLDRATITEWYHGCLSKTGLQIAPKALIF